MDKFLNKVGLFLIYVLTTFIGFSCVRFESDKLYIELLTYTGGFVLLYFGFIVFDKLIGIEKHKDT